jgi:hypothetical protein
MSPLRGEGWRNGGAGILCGIFLAIPNGIGSAIVFAGAEPWGIPSRDPFMTAVTGRLRS